MRPAEPTATADPVAVTMSGGGFRAAVTAIGAVRLLASAGLLPSMRYLSSVSGGSVANGLVAVNWPRLRERDYSPCAVDDLVVRPLGRRLTGRSLTWSLVRGMWRTIGPATRTDLLARRFDEWFFGGRQLADLDSEVRWIVNAANQTSGVRFTFERDVVGDYTIGLVPTRETGITLSRAVAASAAVPGVFAPVVLRGLDFRCATGDPALLDGGTYDNTGLEALAGDRHRDAFLVALDAGGLMRPGGYGRVPLVRDLVRANALLYRQSTTLRTRALVRQFELGRAHGPAPLPRGARRGVLFTLATRFPDPAAGKLPEWCERFPDHRKYAGADLALVPTDFAKLDPILFRALVYRGWWLAGAALAAYHPERLRSIRRMTPPEL
jgi:NTE family protein